VRTITVRRADEADAPAIVAVLSSVVAERVHSAIDEPFTIEEQRRYLAALSAREACHVAVSASEGIVGYQSLDLYSSFLNSVRHVGRLGTFVVEAWRGKGVGHALFLQTALFARAAGFRKMVIEVRGSNAGARAFYQDLGFTECGRLARQVVVDGVDDDQVVMELFL
jgi:L-amino acid N-acyltransferase YncA